MSIPTIIVASDNTGDAALVKINDRVYRVLTDRHNTTFGALDEALLNAKLAPDLRNNRSTLERT